MIAIKQGPHFRGSMSYFGIFLFVPTIFFLIFESSFETLNHSLYTVGLILLFVAGIHLFLGFEGVLIDTENSRIKQYRNTLGVRLGGWLPINDFNELVLDIDRFDVRTGSPLGRNITRHRTFDVVLVGEKYPDGILLFECKDYEAGLKKLKVAVDYLNLPSRDICAETMKASQERRRRRRRR